MNMRNTPGTTPGPEGAPGPEAATATAAAAAAAAGTNSGAASPLHALAEVNIARLKAPIDSPQLKDFVEALDPVNAIADAADGFIWRDKTDSRNDTQAAFLDDDWLIVNLSVWRDIPSLTSFMYTGWHRELLSRRREWFEHMTEAMTVLWWVPLGHEPPRAEAQERLLHLRTHGPTPYAFTFRTSFPAQDAKPSPIPRSQLPAPGPQAPTPAPDPAPSQSSSQ